MRWRVVRKMGRRQRRREGREEGKPNGMAKGRCLDGQRKMRPHAANNRTERCVAWRKEK